MQDEEFTPADGHLPAVLRQFEITRGRALEIGCGSAANVIWLARLGFECTGIDLASAALRLARDQASAAGCSPLLIRGAFPDGIPEGALANGGYDFVFDRGVLELVTAPAQRRKFLKLVAQLLSSGGIYYSLIAKRERRQLPGGGTRWTLSEIRKAISPFLRILLVKPVPLDPSNRASPSHWMCIMKPYVKRRITVDRRFPFIFLR